MAGPGRAVPDGTRSFTCRRKDMTKTGRCLSASEIPYVVPYDTIGTKSTKIKNLSDKIDRYVG